MSLVGHLGSQTTPALPSCLQQKAIQHFKLNTTEQALVKSLDLDLKALMKGALSEKQAGEKAGAGMDDSASAGLQPFVSAFLARINGGKRHMGNFGNNRCVGK